MCQSRRRPTITDPAHIDVYITPCYNSKGPTIEVGSFSSGLAAKNETEFVATIAKMKKSWDTLNFPEMYVAAIRLYDLGYRKESVYWFYSAQYRGRLFGGLIDRDRIYPRVTFKPKSEWDAGNKGLKQQGSNAEWKPNSES